MLTYRDLLDGATKQLYDASETPRIDAEILLQHVIKQPLAWLIAYGDTAATSEHIKFFYEQVSQRQNGEPIAYLIGHREFWTLTLAVDKNVLIPRPDTETLVEHALEKLPQQTSLDVLDLGTGSGAIALSLAKERPDAKVLAIDAHEGALAIAKENAKSNGVSNVAFLKSNWFSDIPDGQQFDLIASNPPYVEESAPHLRQGDLRFEPAVALVAKNKGLADLDSIIETAPQYLNERAWLIVEHGYDQAEQVASMLEKRGYTEITPFKDINKLPRCTLARMA